MTIPWFVRGLLQHFRSKLSEKRGFIVWYLLISVAVIGVFYLIYFLFWSEIKSWFEHGS